MLKSVIYITKHISYITLNNILLKQIGVLI
jgi:hypothetical protein